MHSLFDSRPKTYVDVGSGHPIKGSNTYFMYRAGFRGLLIDPIAANCELIKNYRPEDQVLFAGAGSAPGVMEFFEFEPYQFSTFDHKTKDLRISEGIKFLQSVMIPIVPLRTLGLKSSKSAQTFLSIDTEGWELEVLLGIDFAEFKPDVIVIEDWEKASPGDETRIFHFLKDIGYVWISRLKFSDVYVLS